MFRITIICSLLNFQSQISVFLGAFLSKFDFIPFKNDVRVLIDTSSSMIICEVN